MLSCTIDEKEGRYIVVTDIPVAFLHVDMEESIGTIAKLIIKFEPILYRKHIWYNQKGKSIIYIQLKKALYGTQQAAFLFWRLLSSTLQAWVLKINEYDHCVANKLIEGNNVL